MSSDIGYPSHDHINMSHQSSDISRYRPVIWTLGGVAAAYATYTLYKAYMRLPSTDLRRNNAVHRARRDRYESRVDREGPSPEAPLGTILIQTENATLPINLANRRLPSADMLRSICGSGSEAFRREMQSLAVDMILSNCFASIRDSESRAAMVNLGLGGILTALTTRDGERILQASYDIPRIMHLDTVTQAHVERAVYTLLTSNPSWFTGEVSSSDDEVVDLAETEDWDVEKTEPSQGLRGLLYYIAENEAKRKAYEHRGIGCEECGELPIRGVRWHCLNCPDFDLCSSCETHTRHPKTHVFAKVKIPVPVLSQPTKEMELWYPGDPRKIHASLDVNLKKHLCKEYDYEEPQLDALYDQFTCLANVPWEQDPQKVRSAIDRRAFNKAMSSDRWPAGLASNAMFDRMFAFYDTDNNGLVGFDEFVNGMAYLRGPKRFASLKRTIQGYDLDGDGYVDRADFLRLLRAKHAIQKQLISDQVAFQEQERILVNMDTLWSSQPISSIFADEQIPPGVIRQPGGKRPDAFGDMQPLSDTRTVLEDNAPFLRKRPARERLRGILSRFGELLDEDHSSQLSNGGEGVAEGPLSVRRVVPEYEDEAEDPYLQDILWHITANGFNELLNPLFKARELEDAEIINTHAERKQWAPEIHDAVMAEAHSRRKLMEWAEAKDLRSDTATTFENRAPTLPGRTELTTTTNAGIVPTDWVSLERREAEIADAPLEDLLTNLGYGVRDDESIAASTDARAAPSDNSTIALPPNTTTTAHNAIDPTMPRKDSENISTDAAENDIAEDTRKLPSKVRLNYLARLNDLEREMDERGGPGRLAYDEIEHIVVGNNRLELRGLIKSWLEWASF